MNETNWLPGIVVLVVGAAVSVLLLWLSRRKPASTSAEPAADPKLADLEQRVQLLVEQLRALDAEKHQLGERYAAERARLELEAAAALKARDAYLKGAAAAATAPSPAETTTPTTPAAAEPKGFWARHPELKGALWGAGVVAFFVGVGVMLTRAEQPRGDGEMTGARPPNELEPAQGEDPHLKAFLERAKANPQDTESAAMAAHELIRLQRFDEAEAFTKQALAADPFHLESRIHRSVLEATRGGFRKALDDLGHLARTYPDAWEALLFRGALAMQVGDSRLALESFERFVAEAPPREHPPQIRQAIAMLRQRVGARPE